MRILLTNDDSISSEFLDRTRRLLSEFGEVVTICPENPMSGKSVSGTFFSELTLKEVSKNVYTFNGTPADCVSFGLSDAFNGNFDLVISGINLGVNLGYDILHSGTCGACYEALMFHVPAVAFSMDFGDDKVDEISSVMRFVLNNNLLSKDYFLNVNIYKWEVNKGIKITEPIFRDDYRSYKKIEGKDGVFFPIRKVNHSNIKCSDDYAICHGYTSISAISKNNFHKKDNLKLKKLIRGNK